MSVQWYYIDGAGTTLGPVTESKITDLWCSGGLTTDSYVWNGTTVNEWLGIGSVNFLHTKLKQAKAARNKPAPKARVNPPRPGGGPARPKKKAGGGARMNLLDSIRGGAQLKKVPKKELPAASGGAPSKKPAGKMSLQDQLKMKLSKGRTGGGPAKKKMNIPKKNTGSSGPTWREKQKAKEQKQNEPKKMTWSERQALKKKEAQSAPKSNSGGGYASGGKTPSKIDLKSKIDKCNEDWILRAINKLLS